MHSATNLTLAYNSRRSLTTAESLDEYRDMIKTTTVDLEARLEIIDEKLESILDQSATEPDVDETELQQMKDERLSTQKCLEYCARLFDQINKIPLRPVPRSGSSTGPIGSEAITNEGLRQCKDTLNATTIKLERHMEGLIDRLKKKMPSEEGVAELAMLQDEWESARRGIEICSSADKNISVIDNFSTGDDSVQFLVSTQGKTIHGKNRGFGLRAKQVGGHLSDDSLQQISRDISRTGFQNTGDQTLLSPANTSPVPDDVKNESNEEFRKRYGKGLKLASESAPCTTNSPRGSAEG